MPILSSLENRVKGIGRKIIYKQERIGLYGTPFIIYKFRTMKYGSDVDEPRDRLDKFDKGDKKLLWYGHFLRRTGGDEILQLYNIKKGQMTFVGPRPLIPSEEADLAPGVREKRRSVKPGWWAAGYAARKPLTPEVLDEMDMAFVEMAKINNARAQMYFGLWSLYNVITRKHKVV